MAIIGLQAGNAYWTSTAQGGGAAPVPTLSGGALAALVLLLGSLGYFLARRGLSG